MDIHEIRNDFPSLLERNEKNFPIVYFDNASTSLKPKCVIDASSNVYVNAFGNANRGSHIMGTRAVHIMETVREKVKDFIVSPNSRNIIFTKGATEALNIIAFSYAMKHLKENDEILIGIDSHHANLVPWKIVCDKKGIRLNYFYVNSNGEIIWDDFIEKLSRNPKLVSFTPVTNTFGIRHDYKKVISLCKEADAKVVVDASQAMMSMKFDVSQDDIDFLVFSGHKILAPQGIGVLYVNESIINDMEPFLYGGDMIDYVFEDEVTFKNYFEAFEGGTQNVSSIAGLGCAIDYINSIGMEAIIDYEDKLKDYFLNKSNQEVDFILYGPRGLDGRALVFSFNIKGVHSHDVSTILDSFGIAVRSGHHCSQPFMRKLGINSTVRASLCFYNTKEEIDYFFDKVKLVKGILKF